MHALLDLERYPLDQPDSHAYKALVERCRDELLHRGMFNLYGFLHQSATLKATSQLQPLFVNEAFEHHREHNIYFRDDINGLHPEHTALQRFTTRNRTICNDQLNQTIIQQIYEYPPLLNFLSQAMNKPQLYLMDDPLGRINVMAYREGETLGWHFDRSEFTTTLLLQTPEQGGIFEYHTDLRTATDPNYAGVTKLLKGQDEAVQRLHPTAGTLNVFKGKNTAHQVTPVQGERERIIAVFSFYEQPGVVFSAEEQRGFYGRTSDEK